MLDQDQICCDDKGKLREEIFDDYGFVKDPTSDKGIYCKESFLQNKYFTDGLPRALSATCFSSVTEALKPRCTGYKKDGNLATVPEEISKAQCRNLITGEPGRFEKLCSGPIKKLCANTERPDNADNQHLVASKNPDPLDARVKVCGCHIDDMKPKQTQWYSDFVDSTYLSDLNYVTPDGGRIQINGAVEWNNNCGPKGYYKPCRLISEQKFYGYGDALAQNPCSDANVINCINSVNLSLENVDTAQINVKEMSNECQKHFSVAGGGDAGGGDAGGGDAGGGAADRNDTTPSKKLVSKILMLYAGISVLIIVGVIFVRRRNPPLTEFNKSNRSSKMLKKKR